MGTQTITHFTIQMGIQTMNELRLVIAAVVAIALLYIVASQFTPFFTPETKINTLTEGLLNEAQADLGQSKGTSLTLKEGQSLYARNLDNTTRTVAFACSTPDCCPLIEGCNEPLSVTGDRLIVNDSIKASITARCQEINHIHACKVYYGKEPAQLILENTIVEENITIQGMQELPIVVTVRNIGENTATNIAVTAEWLEDQTVEGVGVPTVIKSDEEIVDSLAFQKNQTVTLGIPIDTLGTFTLRIRATAEDAGVQEKEYTIHVNGTAADLCVRDTSKSEAAFFDSFDQICRKKVFCTGCDFAYECREIWEKEAVITSTFGTGYDPDRGEPGFAYQIWSTNNGTC